MSALAVAFGLKHLLSLRCHAELLLTRLEAHWIVAALVNSKLVNSTAYEVGIPLPGALSPRRQVQIGRLAAICPLATHILDSIVEHALV